MKLEQFVSQYKTQDIIHIEKTKDPTFLSVKSVVQNHGSLGLFHTIICALLSFQLGATGEKRRDERSGYFSQKKCSRNSADTDRYRFMQINQSNRRIITVKYNRLTKLFTSSMQLDEIFFSQYLHTVDHLSIESFADLLEATYNNLRKIFSAPHGQKTIVFAIKMLGYGVRAMNDLDYEYPYIFPIPVDSRLTKIFLDETGAMKQPNMKSMQNFFGQIGAKYNIPALHLDSLLWITYWYEYMQTK